MTLNEFIEELLKLQKEGKGEYKVRDAVGVMSGIYESY